jgi:hypothetical protein
VVVLLASGIVDEGLSWAVVMSVLPVGWVSLGGLLGGCGTSDRWLVVGVAHCWALRNHTPRARLLLSVVLGGGWVAFFAEAGVWPLLWGLLVGVLVGVVVDSWIVDASIFGITRAMLTMLHQVLWVCGAGLCSNAVEF